MAPDKAQLTVSAVELIQHPTEGQHVHDRVRQHAMSTIDLGHLVHDRFDARDIV